MDRIRKLEQAAQGKKPTVIGSFQRIRELLVRSPLRWNKNRLIKLEGMSEAHIVGWLKSLMATAGLDDKSEWRETLLNPVAAACGVCGGPKNDDNQCPNCDGREPAERINDPSLIA